MTELYHKRTRKLDTPKYSHEELDDERKIVERAQSDIQYFEVLYNRYFDQIFGFIYRKTEDEDVTADLTQRVFLNAMNALPRYEYRQVPFGAWLYRIATNETMKHFRESKKRFLSLEQDKVNSVMTCEGLEDDTERLAMLSRLIGELDEDVEIGVQGARERGDDGVAILTQGLDVFA